MINQPIWGSPIVEIPHLHRNMTTWWPTLKKKQRQGAKPQDLVPGFHASDGDEASVLDYFLHQNGFKNALDYDSA